MFNLVIPRFVKELHQVVRQDIKEFAVRTLEELSGLELRSKIRDQLLQHLVLGVAWRGLTARAALWGLAAGTSVAFATASVVRPALAP